MDVYSLYKPLRNYTRQFSIIESLRVIHAYCQHLQFNLPLPEDITASTQFLNATNRMEKGVLEWELDLLAREVIINGAEEIQSRKSLRDCENFSTSIKKIQELENSISEITPDLDENILIEMFRIAHRQFPWQNRPNTIRLTRYFKIFNYPPLDQLLKEIIGLNAKDIYTIGLALTGGYMRHFELSYPQELPALGITKEKYDIFLNHFSRSIIEIKNLLSKSQMYNFDYAYSINPLRIFPLIEFNNGASKSHISPIPTFLFWRFTDGIYYEICDSPKFGNPFGKSFQKYTGEVIAKTKNSSQIIYPEKEYHVGKNRKDTVDWILQDDKCLLFVECKTKKIKSTSKIALTDISSLEDDLDSMADFAIQTYKQIYDFKNGYYPMEFLTAIEKVFPIILTLTDWYAFGPKIIEILDKKIIDKLSELGRGMENYFILYPYTICSIDDFEKAVQIIAEVGANDFMSEKTNEMHRLWPMHSYLYKFYENKLESLKNFFPEDLKIIYSQA